MNVKNHAPVNAIPSATSAQRSAARKWIFEDDRSPDLANTYSNETVEETRSIPLIMEHNLLHLLAIFIACGTFGVTIFFTSGGFGQRLGLFINNTATLADKYYLDKYTMDVTPDEWTFYLTAFIYLWQAVWLLFSVFTTCRRVGDSGPMYTLFPVLPPILFVVFSFALACNISWLLIWDREYMEVALVFINLMSCTLYICLVVTLRRLNDFGGLMLRHNFGKDIWFIRIFVQNGLAMFASWGTVAAMFNFAVVLKYRTGAKEEVGSTVSLTIFTLEIFTWWIFDNFVFEKLLRYLITPYIVILISILGIITRNFNPNSTNSIYTVALLAITCVLTFIKVILLFYRHKKQPIFQSKPKYRRPMVSFEVRSLLEQQPPHNL